MGNLLLSPAQKGTEKAVEENHNPVLRLPPGRYVTGRCAQIGKRLPKRSVPQSPDQEIHNCRPAFFAAKKSRVRGENPPPAA
jgi:hypothetical protein